MRQISCEHAFAEIDVITFRRPPAPRLHSSSFRTRFGLVAVVSLALSFVVLYSFIDIGRQTVTSVEMANDVPSQVVTSDKFITMRVGSRRLDSHNIKISGIVEKHEGIGFRRAWAILECYFADEHRTEFGSPTIIHFSLPTSVQLPEAMAVSYRAALLLPERARYFRIEWPSGSLSTPWVPIDDK
jgi:hypothetical protein